MNGGARLPPGPTRPSGHHKVDHRAPAEQPRGGELVLHLVRVSAHGFIVCDHHVFAKGDRLTVALPTIGRIEAFVGWTGQRRAGFQFERVLSPAEFTRMVEALRQADPSRASGADECS